MKVIKHGNKFRVSVFENGKTKAFSFPTLESAQLFAASHEAQKVKEPKVAASADKQKMIDDYIIMNFNNKEYNTRKNVTSIIKKVIPALNLDKITQADIFNYCIRNKYRSSTSAGVLKWTKHFCDFYKLDTKNIDWKFLGRQLKADDARVKNYLEHADFKKLIEHCDPANQLLYKYMASCGIRREELARLQVENFVRESWLVVIPRDKVKSGPERSAIIPVEIRDEFIKHTNALSENQKDPLFKNKNGSKISVNGLSARFKKHCLKAGIGNRNIHLLRAYAILVILESSNNDYELVRKVAGWESQEMQKYLGRMLTAKDELASNISFDRKDILVSDELSAFIDTLRKLIGNMKPEKISTLTQTPYQFVYNLLEKKVGKELEVIFKIAKHFHCEISVSNPSAYWDKEIGKNLTSI